MIKNNIKKTDIKIGKFILDTITNSLYDNSLDILREFMQNSMDAVSEKYSRDPFNYKPFIKTVIDAKTKQIAMIDNGVGFESKDDFFTKMLSIGNSTKIAGRDRGYRGVGRLSAVYFADEIIFAWMEKESIWVMKWDAKKLKSRIQDVVGNDSTAVDILKETASLFEYSFDDFTREFGFFEGFVDKQFSTMSIIRLSDMLSPGEIEQLTKEEDVTKYVKEVFPLPYSDDWSLRSDVLKIMQGLEKKYFIENNIFDFTFIDKKGVQTDRKIFKGFKDVKGIDSFLIELNDIHAGKMPEIRGWIAFHNTNSSRKIPGDSQQGVLVKHKGITIGDSKFLNKFHKGSLSSWASKWVFGEIEIISKDINPNSARNDFIMSEEYSKLRKYFKTFMANIDLLRRRWGELINYNNNISTLTKDSAYNDKKKDLDIKIEKTKIKLLEIPLFKEELGKIPDILVATNSASKAILNERAKKISASSISKKWNMEQVNKAVKKVLRNYVADPTEREGILSEIEIELKSK